MSESGENNSMFRALLERGKQTLKQDQQRSARPDLRTTSSTHASDSSGNDDSSRSPFNPNRGSRGRPMMIPKVHSSRGGHDRKQVTIARSAPLMTHKMPPAAPIRKPAKANFEPPSLALPPSPPVFNQIPINPLDGSDSSVSPIPKEVSRSLRQSSAMQIAFSAPTFGFMTTPDGMPANNSNKFDLFGDDEGGENANMSTSSSRRLSMQSPIISLLETNSFSMKNSSSLLGPQSSSSISNSQQGISMLPPRPTPSSFSAVPSGQTPTSALTLALQGRSNPKQSPNRSRQQLAQMVREEQRRGSHMDLYGGDGKNKQDDEDELQFAISMDDRDHEGDDLGGGYF